MKLDGEQQEKESMAEENLKDIEDQNEEGSTMVNVLEEDREVFIDRAQLSIFELHRRYQRKDIILRPKFQRKDVWTKPKKSKLIESVLRNIPVPSIYLAETEDDEWEVIDGQQRLTAFFNFLEGEFSLSQLPVLTQLEKKYFKELGTYQRKIEDYQLHIFIIKKQSHPDIRFDIFERINEGAVQLNAQELRNSIYRGETMDNLYQLSKIPAFIGVIKGKVQENRLKDQEAMLRFLSFYLQGIKSYNGNLNSFLNSTLEKKMINNNNFEELKIVVENTMDAIFEVFGERAFISPHVQIKRMNMSLFDILSYSFSQYDKAVILEKKDMIRYSLKELVDEDNEFMRSITSNTLTIANLNYRFETWLTNVQKIIKGDG